MKLLSSKINVLKIFYNHLSTFGDVQKGNKFCDYLTFYILPIVLASVYGLIRHKFGFSGIPERGWNATITINSILIPLTLSMLAVVMGMKAKSNKRASKLIKELVYNISYEVLVSIVYLILALGAIILDAQHSACLSELYVFFAIHLFLTLSMIVKRFYIISDYILCET